jgi:hypothetical protein
MMRRGFHESQSITDTAKQFADRGKRAAVAALTAGVSGLFLFSAILVFVIELGLQIDRSEGIRYSGLMISATILAGLGLMILAATVFLVRRPPPPPPPASNPRSERIKDVLEEFFASFLQQLIKAKDSPKKD